MTIAYKKNCSINEKKELLKKYNEYVGKRVSLVKTEDTKYCSDRHKLDLYSGEIISVSWSSYVGYPLFTIETDLGSRIYVCASRLNTTIFLDVVDAIEKIVKFIYGGTENFHISLPRTHVFSKDFMWSVKKDREFKSEYALSEGNQLLCFNKKKGTVEVVQVMDSLEDKWILSNKTKVSIMEETISNTQEYSYYRLKITNEGYLIEDIHEFTQDIAKYLHGKQGEPDVNDEKNKQVTEEKRSLELNEKTLNDLKKIMLQVVSEKMPEIIDEAIGRYLNNR